MKKTYLTSVPLDITPRDDAYLGSSKFFASEWWYFEAAFENNYSAVFSFTTISKKHLLTFPRIEIYKDGELEVRAIKRNFFQNVMVSTDFPFVKMFDNKIIEFDQEIYQKSGEWVYYVSSKIDNHEIDLTFRGVSQGWKIDWGQERWTVALPKALVSGEIIVHGNRMKVNGIGYHDHNQTHDPSMIFNLKGWLWGKIASQNFNVVWANMKTFSGAELLSVINQKNGEYYTINSANIHFKSDKIIINYGRKMPTLFTLKINDMVNGIPINVDVKMEVKNIHRRFKRLPIAPYWRYHVSATGFISLGSQREEVNSSQIMEFFRLI